MLYALQETKFLPKLRSIKQTSVLIKAFRCDDGDGIGYVNERFAMIGHGHQIWGQSCKQLVKIFQMSK